MDAEDVRIAAKEGTTEALVQFGFSVDKPIEMQKDFSYLRTARLGSEATRSRIRTALITCGVSGFIFVMWEGIKQILPVLQK